VSKFHVSLIVVLICEIVLITAGQLKAYNTFPYVIILLVLEILLIGVMSFSIRSNFFLTAKHHMSDGNVMLTFDDGPHPQYTPQILDILKEKNVKATFFLIGTQIEKYPEIAHRIIDEGHAVGGHSYSHEYAFGFTIGTALEDEIMKTQRLLAEQDAETATWFRPPFGVTNPNIAGVVKKNKLTTMGWSVRSFDTVAKRKGQILSKVLGEVKSGSIVLLHDTIKLTAEALPTLIDEIDAKGLKFDLLKE